MSSLTHALGSFHGTHATEQPAYSIAPPLAAGPQAEVLPRQPWDVAATAGTEAVLAVPPPLKAGRHAAD